MQPLRKNVAMAIDGGGLRGVMVARALAVLEAEGLPWQNEIKSKWGDVVRLAAGTSTGSIISAGLGINLSGAEIHQLYCDLAAEIFPQSWRSRLWPLATYRYSNRPLVRTLKKYLGDRKMSDFWQPERPMDVVITVRDLAQGKTHFIKPWKSAYKDWPAWKAVLASCTIPTYFPVVSGCFVDGGVGSYSNPCFVAAYEAVKCLNWKARETTLISLGTGRVASGLKPYEADRFVSIQWLTPLLDTFLTDANRQQVRLVHEFFPGLDFRRFQMDIPDIPVDDPAYVDVLTQLGNELAQKILNDDFEREALRPATRAPGTGQSPSPRRAL